MITKVSDTLYRGPHPTDFSELKNLGINQVLSLQTGVDDLVNGHLYNEDNFCHGTGITIDHVRLGDILPPTPDEIRACLVYLAEHTGVWYVHCKFGVDRTGIICAAYRVKMQKWPIDSAINEMFDMGFHKFPYQFPLGWVTALRGYLK